jgi:hypothetical protein
MRIADLAEIVQPTDLGRRAHGNELRLVRSRALRDGLIDIRDVQPASWDIGDEDISSFRLRPWDVLLATDTPWPRVGLMPPLGENGRPHFADTGVVVARPTLDAEIWGPLLFANLRNGRMRQRQLTNHLRRLHEHRLTLDEFCDALRECEVEIADQMSVATFASDVRDQVRHELRTRDDNNRAFGRLATRLRAPSGPVQLAADGMYLEAPTWEVVSPPDQQELLPIDKDE